jgi:hypothetical protein
VLGDRAQVLGAVALVVSESDRSLLPESVSLTRRR